MRFAFFVCVFSLSLGVIFAQPSTSSQPRLSLVDFTAGQVATVTVSGATPGGEVIWGCSLKGPGPINSIYGPVELSYPLAGTGSMYGDRSGMAATSATVPRALSGRQIWFHAVDVATRTLTNPATLVIR